MKPDWSRVTVEHVERACEMYDYGTARPPRPARSTFLFLDGKAYPAKFIRGLAYRLATGVELDPNVDYSGGMETVRFFRGLGLATQHGPSSTPAPAATAPAVPPSPPARPTTLPRRQPSSTAPQRRKEPQKEALAALLRRRFGAVEREVKFPWLVVPPPEQMDGTILAIFEALEAMRGYSTFASPGKFLRCDFVVPAQRLVIEYDERQHFTMQRAKSLELYPPELDLGFNPQEWLTTCYVTRATDPTPPYRDEQRAFYDSLRDILAASNGMRLVRLRYGTVDWTGSGGEAQLGNLLGRGQAIFQPANGGTARPADNPSVGHIRKVALVSHDYNVADSRGLRDYSEHFARINKLCDEQGCDTILYALFTCDQDAPGVRDHNAIFDGLDHVERIILEVGQRGPKGIDHIEVWSRGQQAPLLAQQHFAQGKDRDADKWAFINDLPNRRVADGLLMLCGESNIATMAHHKYLTDPFRFNDWLEDRDIRVILNPIHDYMTRFEMKAKRKHYSLSGRTVLSVWNQGKGRDASQPWTVFHDGIERTQAVRELPRPFGNRPDIRIGIVHLAWL